MSNESADPTGAPFALATGEGEITSRCRAARETRKAYKKALADYGPIYTRVREDGTREPLSERGLKRWVRVGREAGDLPPLDEPIKMAEWWRNHMTYKVPKVLVEYEEGGGEGGDAPRATGGQDDAVNVESKSVETGLLPGKIDPSRVERVSSDNQGRPMIESVGFEAALERARQAELATARAYLDALEDKSISLGLLSRRQKAWLIALDAMRKAEQVAERLLRATSEWFRREDVESELNERVDVLSRGTYGLLNRVASKMTIPAELFAQMARLFEGEVDDLFTELREMDFLAYREPLVLDGEE